MRIEHVALYVNDLEGARDFFVRFFGAVADDGYHNPRTGFRSHFLTFDDGARLEVMTKPDMTDAEKGLARTGWAHLAFPASSVPRATRWSSRSRVAARPTLTKRPCSHRDSVKISRCATQSPG